MKVEDVARICHEANRVHCWNHGDMSHVDWHASPLSVRESMVKGVLFRLRNPDAGDCAQHDAWMRDKIADGWVYGPAKNADAKTHHCLVPFDELPEHDRAKDALFAGIVLSLRAFITDFEG